MANYFYGCSSIEEVKARYKKLAKSLHPDAGGSQTEFVEMKNEYDEVLVKGVQEETYYSTFVDFSQEGVTNLSKEDLEHERAVNHFNKLRSVDKTYDIIDDILDTAKVEGNKTIWVVQEVSKLLELELNHFKYLTFKLNLPVLGAKALYNKYLGL